MEKLQRLQLLLLRVRTVVDEADGRCITNSGMLMQLKLLSESMYQGYYVLENFKYRPIMESGEQKVSSSRTLVSFIIGASIKRFCMGALLMCRRCFAELGNYGRYNEIVRHTDRGL